MSWRPSPWSTFVTSSVALVTCCFAVAQESKPASQPTTYDLRYGDKPAAFVVDLVNTVKGKLQMKRGSTEATQTVDERTSARWLDELGSLDEFPIVDKRTYVEFQVTKNGAIRDPALAGVTFTYTESKDDVHVVADPPRRVLKKTLHEQLPQSAATGLRIGLPESLAVGQTVRVKARSLVTTLLSLDDALTDDSYEVTLDKVDEKTGYAALSGMFTAIQDVTKSGMTFRAVYKGTLALQIDPVAHRTVSAAVAGTSTVKGIGDAAGMLSGEVKFEAKATSAIAQGIPALKARKPVFRECQLEHGTIAFKLPSCWIDLGATDGPKQFLDSRLEKDDVIIEIVRVDEAADPSADDFIKSLVETLKQTDPKAKGGKASFTAGKGSSYELTNGDQAIRIAVLPFGKSMIRARLIGPSERVPKAEAEYKTFLNSIKKA